MIDDKKWSMDIPLGDLISHNTNCKIDLKSSHHFETYNGVLIYVTHPEGEEDFSIQLGISEDGITYEGDYGCREEFKEILLGEGLDILYKYRDLMVARNELETCLLRSGLGEHSVKVNVN